MKLTEFFKFKKPEIEEYYDLGVQNENMDMLDTQLHALENTIRSHAGAKSNPHGVTKSDVGLDQVDNTSDREKPVSDATKEALEKKQDKLLLDEQPTQSSSKFLTSGSIFEALGKKQNELTLDKQPTKNSLNFLTSGAIFEALKSLKIFTPCTSTKEGVAGLVPAPPSSEMFKFLRADGTWSYPSNTPPEEYNSNEVINMSLQPDVYYSFNKVTSLTLELELPDDRDLLHEYHFAFICGEKVCELTLPYNISFPEDFELKKNTIYEISIVDKMLVYAEWPYDSE